MGEPADHAAAVRRMLEALSTVLVAGLGDEDVRARYRGELASQATDDFELVPMGTEAGPLLTPFHGVDGVLAFWDEWLAPWQEYSFELETLVEGDDAVLVDLIQRGRMGGAPEAVEARSAAVFRFRGDQVARLELYLDRAQARAAFS